MLGGLLLDNAAWDRIADVVNEDDFYRFDHRIIWQHISRLIGLARPADVVTVYESLASAGKADEVGGLAYLNALAQNTPSAANIRRYAEIVRERSMLRKLVTVADEISAAAFNPQGKDTRQMLDEAESKVFQIAEEGARGDAGFQEMQPLLTQGGRAHRRAVSPRGAIRSDGRAYRLYRSRSHDLRPAGGRPGHRGRPAVHGQDVVLDEYRRARGDRARLAGGRVLDGNGRVAAGDADGGVGGHAGSASHAYRQAHGEDWPKLTHAVQQMQDAQLYIDETPALTSMEVRARARRLARQCGQLGLIIIDYLQLMSANSPARTARPKSPKSAVR